MRPVNRRLKPTAIDFPLVIAPLGGFGGGFGLKPTAIDFPLVIAPLGGFGGG